MAGALAIADQSPESSLAKKRILIVDPSFTIHRYLTRIITNVSTGDHSFPCSLDFQQSLPFSVESVRNSSEAYERTQEAYSNGSPFCVTILDLRHQQSLEIINTINQIWSISPDSHFLIGVDKSQQHLKQINEAFGISDQILFLGTPHQPDELRQAVYILSNKWSSALDHRDQIEKLSLSIEQLQSEIERRCRAEQIARFNSIHDPLTKLPNRDHFIELLMKACEGTCSNNFPDFDSIETQDSPRFSVVSIDIDGFGVVADGLDNDVVDRLICTIARRLQAGVGRDDIVARPGGDRFLLLLHRSPTSLPPIMAAEKILAKLHLPVSVCEHRRMRLTACAGVSIPRNPVVQAKEILSEADLALSTAKKIGRGRACLFTDDMHRNSVKRLEIEEGLHNAIEQEKLHLNYQPIVDIQRGEIVGFEALVRWQDPILGFVSPATFIPVAEDSGLIIPLGHWVLNQAIKQLREFQTIAGSDLHMSINVSTVQLFESDFIEDLDALVQSYGCDDGTINLEITESAVMRDSERAIEMLHAIQSHNMRVHIDDFGTGYSSLGYLQKLPLNALKIDRCFINNIETNRDNRAIVRTILSLAQTLGLNAVAEGIEIREQLQILRDLGCQYAQGYYFARPVSPDLAVQLLHSKPRW